MLILHGLLWSGATLLFYQAGKRLYQRLPRWWSSPLIVAPLLLMGATLLFQVPYGDYIRGTRWLLTLLAPTTVAFAVPIYEQRALIRRHWPLLIIGMVAGSITAIASSWMLANAFGLSDSLRLSLLSRSLSTPFAMVVSGDIGGVPALTAVFVILTGLLGAVVGEAVLCFLPLRSVIAQGALFGMGAHAVGTAKALQIDVEIGAISGLVMVLVGVSNVLATPLLIRVLAALNGS